MKHKKGAICPFVFPSPSAPEKFFESLLLAWAARGESLEHTILMAEFVEPADAVSIVNPASTHASSSG